MSSPFLPTCLRFNNTTPLKSNSKRAKEASKGISTIRDESLNEVLSLDEGDVSFFL